MFKDIYIPIKKEPLLFYTAFFCVIFYSLMESSTTTFVYMSIFRMRLIVVATVCCVLLVNEFFSGLKNGDFIKITLITTIFIALLFLGMYFGTGGENIRHVLNMVEYVFDIFVLTVVASKDDRIKVCIKLLLIICCVLCIVNDFVDITGIVKFPITRGSLLKRYVIGTKFSVVYLHLNTLAIYVTNELLNDRFTKKNIVIVYTALLAILGIAVHVDCSTGIIGAIIYAVLFTVLFLGKEKNKTIIVNKYTFLLCILIATFILVFLQAIVNIPFIADFIVNTLNRDLTLTGRLIIFVLYIPVMSGHWLWGYGLGNAFTISSTEFLGVSNAQNLILQWVLQIGIIPVIAMLIWLFSYYGMIDNCRSKKMMFPLIALIHTYIWLGIGEITLKYNFFMFVFLIANIAIYVRKVESLNEN